jgi:hypothetical protein
MKYFFSNIFQNNDELIKPTSIHFIYKEEGKGTWKHLDRDYDD